MLVMSDRYDNNKMDMLLDRYPIVNVGWKHSMTRVYPSLGELVTNVYMNSVSNNGGYSMTPMDIAYEGYVKGNVADRGYNGVYSYFVRNIDYNKLVRWNGGQEYYINRVGGVPELLTDPWFRMFVVYDGVVHNDMVGMYDSRYDGMVIKNRNNNIVICSIEVTSIEGHRVYCMHLYS
jgi:hypothetical protein